MQAVKIYDWALFLAMLHLMNKGTSFLSVLYKMSFSTSSPYKVLA